MGGEHPRKSIFNLLELLERFRGSWLCSGDGKRRWEEEMERGRTNRNNDSYDDQGPKSQI